MINRIVFLIGILFSLLTTNAFAVTIDLWSIFPKTTQGENGVFLYGYNSSRSTPYRALSWAGDYSFNTPGQPFNVPLITRSSQADGSWIVLHPTAQIQAGTIYGPEDAVFAYRAAESNTYDISGDFSLLAKGSVGTYIYKNNSLLWSNSFSGISTKSFDLQDVTLNTNDKLFFGISAGANDYYDTSAFRAKMAVATPEPATVLLFSLGGAGMALLRRRKA